MKNLQWKILLVLVLAAIAAYGIYPPEKRIKLGLDLKGGIHLVAEVKLDEALAGYSDQFIDTLRTELQEKNVPVKNITRQTNTSILIDGIPRDREANLKKIMEPFGEWELGSFQDGKVIASLRQGVINSKGEEALKLALQIIRERVDTFGVSESIVQRQGLTGSRVIVQLPGVEDTDRVKRLIEGTAKLELKLVTAGPAPTREGLLAAQKGQVPPGAEVLPHTGVRDDGSAFTEYLLVKP